MKINSRDTLDRSLTVRMGAGVMNYRAHPSFAPAFAHLLRYKNFESKSSHI
jgi:hypothetical protein